VLSICFTAGNIYASTEALELKNYLDQNNNLIIEPKPVNNLNTDYICNLYFENQEYPMESWGFKDRLVLPQRFIESNYLIQIQENSKQLTSEKTYISVIAKNSETLREKTNTKLIEGAENRETKRFWQYISSILSVLAGIFAWLFFQKNNKTKSTAEVQEPNEKNDANELAFLKESIHSKDSELKRYKEGYDIKVFKSYLGKFVRLYNDIYKEYRFTDGDAKESMKDMLDLFEDALNECEIKIITPTINQPKEKYKNILSGVEKIRNSDNVELKNCIAEVLTPAFILQNENNELIRGADIAVYN